jgi:predicted ATPase
MQLTLQNFGKIQDAAITLPGITVITGSNNTGKSTFGKVLCGLLCVAFYGNKWDGIVQTEQCNSETLHKDFFTSWYMSRYGATVTSKGQFDVSGTAVLSIQDKVIEIAIRNGECVKFIDTVNFQHAVKYIDVWFLNHWKNIKEKPVENKKLSNMLQLLHFVNDYYADPLRVSSGMTLFFVLKKLLRWDTIKEHDVLIFDKPESHLHPEWQIILAELLILLQQELDVTIVLTTHSAYLMDGIEVFSEKYALTDRCKYYFVTNKDGFGDVRDVSGNRDVIYQSLAKPFQQLENMRYS